MLTKRLVTDLQEKTDYLTSRAITEASHIKLAKKKKRKKKSLFLIYPEWGSEGVRKSVWCRAKFQKCHFWDRIQGFSWQIPLCLQQQIKNLSIFTCITVMLQADVLEQQPDIWTSREFYLLSCCLDSMNFSANMRFWLLLSGLTAGNEKWSIPSCRASIWHSTCCLLTPGLRRSLNSSVFRAESAQAGDLPLWDWSTHGEREREKIWGARLSGLWGVMP